MSTPTGQSATVEAPDFNRKLHLYIYPPGWQKSFDAPAPSGRPGNYRIRFVLSTPGEEEFFSTGDVKKIMESGGSPLRIKAPPGQVIHAALTNGTESAVIVFGVNAKKEVSFAEITIKTTDFREAYHTAYNLIMPQLSWWSYSHDAAIGVLACIIREENTKVEKLIVGCLGKSRDIDGVIGKPSYTTPIWRTVFSSYREALNANNAFFQFLSFYKVIEAVGKIRDARREQELGAGRVPQTPPERIPDPYTGYSLDAQAFAPYHGKKFAVVCDEFRETARNAIAHLDPFRIEPSLVADRCADVEKCETAIPVIKYIAREMVKNEIAADPEMSAPPARKNEN